VLAVDLPRGFAVDWTGMGGFIHPDDPGSGFPGKRPGLRANARPELRINLHCFDIAKSQEQALEEAVGIATQRFHAVQPMVGLAPDERGLQGTTPNGRTMFVLVKSRPEGGGTRVCVLDGGANPVGFASLRQISRGVRLR
jgi:hypothetical protein